MPLSCTRAKSRHLLVQITLTVLQIFSILLELTLSYYYITFYLQNHALLINLSLSSQPILLWPAVCLHGIFTNKPWVSYTLAYSTRLPFTKCLLLFVLLILFTRISTYTCICLIYVHYNFIYEQREST